MPMANPLTESGVYATPTTSSDGWDPTLSAGHGPAPGGGVGITAAIGTGDITGAHNTPIQVAGLVILALVVVFAFQALGFRVAFDAGLGRG